MTARRIAGVALAALLAVAVRAAADAAPENDPHYQPVRVVAPYGFTVTIGARSGVARYFGTGTLEGNRTTTRALINVHGLLRNGDVYQRTGEAAIAAAGETAATLLITPQFLAKLDVDGYRLPAETLRWDVQTWLDGTPAHAPVAFSSFDVLDAMIARLSDTARFPALREIVLTGFSAGGQLVQRYAVVGRPNRDTSPGRPAPRVRYVVSDPSSYLYFDHQRPDQAIAAACPGFNKFKYGPDDPPPYVHAPIASLEAAYVLRRVTYLLGQSDTDPHHPVLDVTCPAEAEGPQRLARGRNYIAYLHARHPEGTRQEAAEAANIAHDAAAMFTSPCGIAVLFDRPRSVCAAHGPV